MPEPALRRLEELEPGDHLCCIYRSEDEHRSLVAPFLRRGLEGNQKVIYIADAHSAFHILAYLREEGLDAAAFMDKGQLVMLTSDEAYTKEGSFDPDLMIELLHTETERPSTRVTGPSG